MTIHIQGTYRAGVIHPEQPLALPENTPVTLTVTPTGDATVERPPAPKFTAEELRERLDRYAVSVGALKPDFSRADIYEDHD